MVTEKEIFLQTKYVDYIGSQLRMYKENVQRLLIDASEDLLYQISMYIYFKKMFDDAWDVLCPMRKEFYYEGCK